MFAEQFSVGDVVQLKSGGPKMTVTTISSGNRDDLYCKWFEGNKVYEEIFPTNALIKVSEDEQRRTPFIA